MKQQKMDLEQDGAPDKNQGGLIGTDNERKLSRREQIADNADSYRATDLTDLDGDPVARPKPDEEEDEEEGSTERVEAKEEEKEERKLKLKVNGQEIELTEAEVIERAQKVSSADEYLRTASEAVKNATRLALPVKDEQPKVEKDYLALARAIQMGSEEEAVTALRAFEQRPSEVTPDVVAKVVDERLSFQRAAEWFNGEYKDILSDPLLKELAYSKDSALAQAEPNLSYSERLKRVGDEIRSWRQKIAPPKIDKAARKAQVAPVPSAAGRQQGIESDEPEDSPEAVIAAMAKQRGQGRPISH